MYETTEPKSIKIRNCLKTISLGLFKKANWFMSSEKMSTFFFQGVFL